MRHSVLWVLFMAVVEECGIIGGTLVVAHGIPSLKFMVLSSSYCLVVASVAIALRNALRKRES